MIRLEYEGDECRLKFNKSDELFWRESIAQNKKITRSPMTSEEFQMEDVDQVPSSSMQIHLKGVPHIIPVSPLDNAAAIAEDFVVKHKLKADITARIESELLRTQIDACLAHQTRLRQQVGHLRRLLIDAAMFEARASSTEQAMELVSSRAHRIHVQLRGVQSHVKNLEADREKLINDVAKLQAEYVTTAEALAVSRRGEELAQRKLQVAVEQCHLLEGKLKAAAEHYKQLKHPVSVGDTSSHSREQRWQAPRPERRPLDDSDRQCSWGDGTEAGAVRAAVQEATARLSESYEQKMMLYEARAKEHSRVVVGLEKAQMVDRK